MLPILFLLLLLFSFSFEYRFLNVYQSKNDKTKINGIISNEFFVAFVTKDYVTFGEILTNFTILEKSNVILTKNLINDSRNLLEFKFIDNNSVIICNGQECCTCKNHENSTSNFCITVAEFPILSVNAQKFNDKLFLRVVHEKSKAFIYLYKFENEKWKIIGNASDYRNSNSMDSEFTSIYSFSLKEHTYFITRIKRTDLSMKLLSNLTRKNTEIVITQICNSDESDDIISRMDLVLACEGVEYSNPKTVINNTITSSLYLSDENTLFVAVAEGRLKKSLICKFDMDKIEKEFFNTWSYCQTVENRSTKNCNKTSYDELSRSGCLKLEWKIKMDYPQNNDQVPFCQKFGNYRNNVLNSCESAKLFSSKNRRFGWLENIEPLFGKPINETFNSTLNGLYSNNKFVYALLNNAEFKKVCLHLSKKNEFNLENKNYFKFTMDFQNFSTQLNFNTKIPNNKFITSLHGTDGILFIHPTQQHTIYFKNTSCEIGNKCVKVFLIDSYQCGLCPSNALPHSPTPCNLETQSICSPAWFKISTSTSNKSDWSAIYGFNDINGQRFQCTRQTSKKIKCSKTLANYLKPFFEIPFLEADVEAEEPGNLYSLKFYVAVITVSAILLFLTCFFIIFYFWWKNKQKKSKKSSYLQKYLIPSKKIIFLELLGTGISSDVFLAKYKNSNSRITTKVAVKILQEPYSSKNETFKEIKNLSQFQHKNIVKFIGWMKQEKFAEWMKQEENTEKICIITELMQGGNLNSYLLTSDKLLLISTVFSYTFQILDAMIYLEHKHILHRDLAARNCLLNETYEIVKVTDFGLARESNFNYEYISEANPFLPYRWLPLEALNENPQKVFSSKGDVWAFGILLWEMFERGGILYNGMEWRSLKKFLKSGQRLQSPQYCPLELYNVMLCCWDEDPSNRPNFDILKRNIESIFEQIKQFSPDILNISLELTDNENEDYERPKSSS